MTESDKKAIIKQDMQRIIQLEPQIHRLVGLLDLGISSVYDREETIEIATSLSDTLGQMDSDLAALVDLLNEQKGLIFIMAHKKAAYDYQYNKCFNEARRIAEKWFTDNKLAIDYNSIYIVWFAFTKAGYRCMVTSKMYPNNFFEISKNIHNNEMICHVLQQVECIVHPSQAESICMHEQVDDLLD